MKDCQVFYFYHNFLANWTYNAKNRDIGGDSNIDRKQAYFAQRYDKCRR